MKWTRELDEKLKELHGQGLKKEEIALKLNTSINVISYRKHTNDLCNPNNYIVWSDNRIEKLKNLYEQGFSINEIANNFGFSRGCITTKAFLLGLKTKNRRRKWTLERDNKLKELYSVGKTYDEIAEILNTSFNAVHYRASSLGLKRVHEFTESEREFIKNNHVEHCVEYCAKKINAPLGSTYNKICDWGLQLNREERRIRFTNAHEKENWEYKVNADKFINITMPEVAYFLGYFWADGHIKIWANKNGTIVYTFCMAIQQEDYLAIKETIEKIGDFNIYLDERKKKNSTWKDCISIYTSNKVLVKYLVDNDFQIKSQTTPTKILNKIPEHLKHYFFRGWFDGDGCLYDNKNKLSGIVSISGTYDQDWSELLNLLSFIGIKGRVAKRITKEGKRSDVIFGKQKYVMNFGRYIYKNREIDKIGLNRKYNKWIKYSNKVISKHPELS